MQTRPFQATQALTDLLINRQDMLVDREQVFDHIAQSAKQGFKADLFITFAINPLTGNCYPPLISGELKNPASVTLVDVFGTDKNSQDIWEEMAFFDDLDRFPGHQNSFTLSEGIRSVAALTLHSNKYYKPFASLLLCYRQLHHFGDTEQEEIKQFAKLAQIAVAATYTKIYIAAVESHRIVIEGQQRLRALHTIDQSVLDDQTQVIRTIIESALQLTGAQLGELHLLQYDRFTAFYVVQVDDLGGIQSTKYVDGYESRQLERSIVQHVAATKKIYLAKDIQNDPIYIAGEQNVRSEIAIPLLSAAKELIGVLNLESDKPGFFDESDAEILELLADHAVVAIQNAKNYASAQRRQKRFELLLTASQTLAAVTNLGQMEYAYEQVVHFAQQYRPWRAVIHRYEKETQELVVFPERVNVQDSPLPRLKLNQGIISQVFREQQSQRIKDTKLLPPDGGLYGVHQATRSLLIQPISFEKNTYGTLTLSSPAVDYFYRSDMAFIEGLASQLALTIHRLEVTQARQEAEQRAIEAEIMGSIGESAYVLTHRLGNDLGLVSSYIAEIQVLLQRYGVEVDQALQSEFNSINQDVNKVLALSRNLRTEIINEQAALEDKAERDYVTLQRLINIMHEALPYIPPYIQLEFMSIVCESTINIWVNSGQIVSILHELISNAIEAMSEGGIIKINTSVTSEWIIIEVTDNGPGITEAEQQKIFNLFYSTKHSSGFGLWKARRQALRHNGDLKVLSERGKGATFQVYLPRVMSSN